MNVRARGVCVCVSVCVCVCLQLIFYTICEREVSVRYFGILIAHAALSLRSKQQPFPGYEKINRSSSDRSLINPHINPGEVNW